MKRFAIAALIMLTLTACVGNLFGPSLQDVDNQLTSALAGEQVVIAQHDNTITLTSSADYLYPSGGWELRPEAPVLSKMVPIFRKFRHTAITVTGYTDTTPIGPQLRSMGITNNVELSLKRAVVVMTYFQSQGVRPELLRAQGFGESSPVASNDTPEGRALNRRVEITVTGDGS